MFPHIFPFVSTFSHDFPMLFHHVPSISLHFPMFSHVFPTSLGPAGMARMEMPQGQVLAVAGKCGQGKSTLIRRGCAVEIWDFGWDFDGFTGILSILLGDIGTYLGHIWDFGWIFSFLPCNFLSRPRKRERSVFAQYLDSEGSTYEVLVPPKVIHL